MRVILLLFFAIQAVTLTAQSDYTTLILLVQNKQQEGIKYEEVTIKGKKDKKVQTGRTAVDGKVRFKVKKGDTYTISFADAPNYKVLEISKNSRSITPRKITYEGSKGRITELTMDTVAQWLTSRAKPTEKAVLYRIFIRDKDRKLIKNQDIWLVNDKLKKTYYGRTNREGFALFLVPKGKEYVLNFPKDPNYKTLSVPDAPFLVKQSHIEYVSEEIKITEKNIRDTIYQTVPETQMATRKRVRVRIFIRDLDDQPLENEKVFMRSSKGKVYTSTTGQDGVTYLLIPKGDVYSLNFEYEKGLDSMNYPLGDYLRNDKIRYRYLGSKIIKKREQERARALAIRDSLYEIGELDWAITSQLMEETVSDKKVKERIEKQAKHKKEQIQKDPNYFVKEKEPVMATLHRMINSWKRKIIITDVTCSMYGNLDEVLIWHSLKLAVDEKNQYLFFNDGDGKPLSEKYLGRTGGIYHTKEANIEGIMRTMKAAMSKGCSGDGPENDLEALIEGVLKREGLEEIILIADNYSDVRDIQLLTQLNVPIRIILAKVDSYGVNEQYLEIAYKTGGSIHTLEDDIYGLTKLLDGEVITIGKFQYRVLRGKFIQIDKS